MKKSVERDMQTKNQLQKLGLKDSYTRFEGINGLDVFQNYQSTLDAGSLGCGLSHVKIVEDNLDSNEHLHIIEDDIILHPSMSKVFESVAGKIEWDLIYTDLYFSLLSPVNFYKINEKIKLFKEKNQVSLMSLKGIPFSSATSYFINKSSIKKVSSLIGKEWIKNNEKRPMHINRLTQQGKLKAFVFLPFVTTISAHNINSTINESYNSNLLAMDMLRKALFIGADINTLAKEAKSHSAEVDDNPLIRIYTETTKMILDNMDKNLYVKKVKN